jgi:hypothetical protein
VHPLSRADGHPSRTAVAGSLVRSTRGHRAGSPQTLAQAPKGPLDLAPGGVYLAVSVTCDAGGLLHHRFTLTLQPRLKGGLLSVALSRGSPRVGVTDHPAVWSPDLPHRAPKDRRDRPADSPARQHTPGWHSSRTSQRSKVTAITISEKKQLISNGCVTLPFRPHSHRTRHTSQRCAECGHVAAGNRVTQAAFQCLACGHQAHADVNAAINLLRARLALREA